MMIPTIADAIPAKVVAAAAAAEKTSLLIDGRVAGRASARQGCGKVWLSEVDDCACYGRRRPAAVRSRFHDNQYFFFKKAHFFELYSYLEVRPYTQLYSSTFIFFKIETVCALIRLTRV